MAPGSTSSKAVQRVEKTFRVKGLRLNISVEQREQLVQDLLEFSKDETGLQCHSLATHHSGTSQDATMSFNKSCPPCLLTKLPYSIDTGAEDDSATLTFDESFIGLTTLNGCSENEHQVK